MHFSSYLTPCYYIRSPGRPLPLRDGDVTWMSGNSCTALVQPSSFNHNVIYEKEITRQAMLNHEAAFRYQICELHRLYKRQKELMAEDRMREIAGHQLLYHNRSQSDRLVYPIQPGIAQKTVPPWLLVNAEGSVPYLLDEKYPQRPSFDRHSLQSKNISSLKHRSPSHNEGMPPKINPFGKRMLDLELLSNLDIHRDEQDNICKSFADVPPTLRPLAKETPEFHLKSVQAYPSAATGSLNINASRGGPKLCIDLNEPIQLDDESYSFSHLNSATCSTQTVHLSPVPSQKPINESNASIGDSVLNVLYPKEKQVEHQPLNIEAESDKVILLQNSSAKGNILGSNITCESHDSSTTFGSCILCSSQLVPHSADSDFKALSSVTSQRKYPSDLREVPLAVQALPCSNAIKMTKGPKSAYATSRNHSNELTVKKSSENNADSGKEPFQVHMCLAKKIKNLHHPESLEYVDLNCMPLDFETLARNDCKEDCKAPQFSDLMMSEDNVEVGDNARSSCNTISVKHDKGGNIGKYTECKQFSCTKYLNSQLDEDEPPAASSESATVIKHQGTEDINIDAPASPENSECHPPRGESEDTFEIPLYLQKEDEFNVGELDKVAAEAIISMSSSRGAMAPEPSSTLGNCLNWFAGIASSVSEDLCDGIKKLGKKAPGSDDHLLESFQITNLGTRKVSVRRAKDGSSRGKKQNQQGETYECFPLQGRGRRSKQSRILKEKYLLTIGMGRRTDVVTFDNAKRRKSNTGNSFAKRSLCISKAKIAGHYLQKWGSTKGKRKARRARRIFNVFIHALSFTDADLQQIFPKI